MLRAGVQEASTRSLGRFLRHCRTLRTSNAGTSPNQLLQGKIRTDLRSSFSSRLHCSSVASRQRNLSHAANPAASGGGGGKDPGKASRTVETRMGAALAAAAAVAVVIVSSSDGLLKQELEKESKPSGERSVVNTEESKATSVEVLGETTATVSAVSAVTDLRPSPIAASSVTDKYNMGELLGEGGYGTVHMATRKIKGGAAAKRMSGTGSTEGEGDEEGGCVALKKIQKANMDQVEFMKEFAVLKVIHDAGGHPNIAGMEEMFEDEEHFYLVLELVSGGELFEHLCTNGPYSEQTAAILIRDLAHALSFLHSRGIVHADLKPENLMLSSWDDEKAQVKLVDFGCSMISRNSQGISQALSSCVNNENSTMAPGLAQSSLVNHSDTSRSDRGDEFRDHTTDRMERKSSGTPAYWPPEIVASERRIGGFTHTPAADMWAAGVIIFIMLVGSHPFDLYGDANDEVILDRIMKQEVPLGDDVLGHLSLSARDLVRQLMETDPSKRLTAAGMLDHPWVKGDTARVEVMEGADERLAKFQEVLKSKLETGLFALLVQESLKTGRPATGLSSGLIDGSKGAAPIPSVQDAVGVIKKAFGCFDKDKKGFVSASDIARVLRESGEDSMSDEESAELDQALTKNAGGGGVKGVGLESFEEMMSALDSASFGRGDFIFREGDSPDFMYIINSGKVEVLKDSGDGGSRAPPTMLTTLVPGQIFGESSMLEEQPRSASIRCITPVQVIRIGKDSLQRMMKGSKSASANLREMSILREMSRAKSILRAVGGVLQRQVLPGEAVVTQGEVGSSMYTVAKGSLDVLVEHPGEQEVKVATLSPGDVFGEMALMLRQPRNATVRCSNTVMPHRPSPPSASADIPSQTLIGRGHTLELHRPQTTEVGYGEQMVEGANGPVTSSGGSVGVGVEGPAGSEFAVNAATVGKEVESRPTNVRGECCIVNEIHGDDFVRMLGHSQNFSHSMHLILRTRLFRHEMLRLWPGLATGPFSDHKLRESFDAMDIDGSGFVDQNELILTLKKLKSKLTEEDVVALIKAADLSRDGVISFEEFKSIMMWEAGASRLAGHEATQSHQSSS